MHRVVVTGMGGVSALGSEISEVMRHLQARENRVRLMPEWSAYPALNTQLAAPILDFSPPAHWTRKQLRSMGRVAQLAVRAAELALIDGGLDGEASIRDGRMGAACGSSTGSTPDVIAFSRAMTTGESDGTNASSYIRLMPHTTVTNIGLFFGLTGRIIPTSSACTSGSQGIGYAYEAIRHGMQTMMLAGGAEELCPSEAMVFDALYATSTRHDEPHLTPRPYDQHRDGLVVGEGAGILLLESLDSAQARGAHIHAEIVGFGTNADGSHITRPQASTMQAAMELSLRQAGIDAHAIGYVNGHGTATEQGDIAETQATAAALGKHVPMSSLKSYIGHTLGACGALEAWISIAMMNVGWFAPTINLDTVDPRCAELDYIQGEGRALQCDYVMSNNFAFGGINTSLIFRRWAD